MRKPGPIDLRSLRYLLAIVDEGSFARAAATLSITQPALSRSMQALEQALGVRLLDRGKSGATPTVFGRLLIERGRRLVADAGAITREMALLGGAEIGDVTVGAGTYPAEICVGLAAARLLRQRPNLKLRIMVGDWPDLTEHVLAERIDLAICDVAAAETNPRLHVELLPSHQGVLFCRTGHPLATTKAPTLEDVRDFPIALTALPDRLASRLLRNGANDGKLAAHAAHVDTFGLARDIALNSDTVAAATEPQIAEDVRAGRAVVLPIDVPWLATRYGFIRLAGRTLSPSLELLMAEVRAVERSLAGEPVGGHAKARPKGRRSTKRAR